MAEDISPTAELVDECIILSSGCSYTAVSFTIWLRWLRGIRVVCEVAPVVFGALATWKIVAQGSPISAAVFTLLATTIPPAFRASKTDRAIEDYAALAGEFTNLRDRFRQAANVSSKKGWSAFEGDVKPLLARLEKARQRTLTPPDLFFLLSRRKHKQGHYEHDLEEAKKTLNRDTSAA